MCLMYLQLVSVIAYWNIMVFGEQCHLSTMVYHDGIKDRRDQQVAYDSIPWHTIVY